MESSKETNTKAAKELIAKLHEMYDNSTSSVKAYIAKQMTGFADKVGKEKEFIRVKKTILKRQFASHKRGAVRNLADSIEIKDYSYSQVDYHISCKIEFTVADVLTCVWEYKGDEEGGGESRWTVNKICIMRCGDDSDGDLDSDALNKILTQDILLKIVNKGIKATNDNMLTFFGALCYDFYDM